MNLKTKLNQIEKDLKRKYCNCCVGPKVESEDLQPIEIGEDRIVMLPAFIPVDENQLVIKDFCDHCHKPISKKKVKSAHRKFIKLLLANKKH